MYREVYDYAENLYGQRHQPQQCKNDTIARMGLSYFLIMKAEAASVLECINHEQCEATVGVRKSTSNLHGIRRNGSSELTKYIY